MSLRVMVRVVAAVVAAAGLVVAVLLATGSDTPPEPEGTVDVTTAHRWASAGPMCLTEVADLLADAGLPTTLSRRVPLDLPADGGSLEATCTWEAPDGPAVTFVTTAGTDRPSRLAVSDVLGSRTVGDVTLWLAASGDGAAALDGHVDDLLDIAHRRLVAMVDGAPVEAPTTDADVSVVALPQLQFDPAELAAPAGTIDVQLAAPEGFEHQFAVDVPDGPDPVAVHLFDGGSDVGQIDLEPGTYTFYCGVPGHREAGMEGTLVVE